MPLPLVMPTWLNACLLPSEAAFWASTTVPSPMLMSPWLMPCPLAISVPAPSLESRSPLGLLTCQEDAFAVGYDNACTLPCVVFTDDGEVAVELQCACALVDIVCQHQCFVVEPAG